MMHMKRKWKKLRCNQNSLLSGLFAIVIFGFGLMTFAHPVHAVSISERRKLASFPAFSFSEIWNGKYFGKLETYMLDQFPLRDLFLRIKAYNQFYIYKIKDNHNIFIHDGTAVALSYPFPDGADELAAQKMAKLIDTYFNDMNVYVSIIPDKACISGSK